MRKCPDLVRHIVMVLAFGCVLGVSSCDRSQSEADSSPPMDGPGESLPQSICQALNTGDTQTILDHLEDGHSLDMILKNCGMGLSRWDGMTPLIVAIGLGHFELVQAMLEHGVSPHLATEGYGAPIHVAAQWNRTRIVSLLLDLGADMESEGVIRNTPLLTAAVYGNVDVVELLLERGADVHVVNEYGGTVLHAAANSGNLEFLKLVFAQGFDINLQDGSGNIPLIDAIDAGSIDLVRYIIEQGGNAHFVNKTGVPGFTTMHMAAYVCHMEIVELLLSLEVDVDVLDHDGVTPLAEASFCRESSDIALLLLEHGADVNYSALYGQAPLHKAVGAEMPDTISLLIERGADVNKTFYPFGQTALMYAVLHENVEIVKQLLESGADPSISTTNGKTAASIASEYMNNNPLYATILELLESYDQEP